MEWDNFKRVGEYSGLFLVRSNSYITYFNSATITILMKFWWNSEKSPDDTMPEITDQANDSTDAPAQLQAQEHNTATECDPDEIIGTQTTRHDGIQNTIPICDAINAGAR